MVTMKFGAAADDAGNLEFTTFHKAATFWVDNFVTPPSNPNDGTNSQHSMTDDVTFLQVGIETTSSSYVFPDKLDSRGYSFTVNNPEGHDKTNTSALFIFQNFRHADLTFNRLLFSYNGSNFALGMLDSTYLHEDSYEIAFYNCVFINVSLLSNNVISAIHKLTVRIFNCIFYRNAEAYLNNVKNIIVENSMFYSFSTTINTDIYEGISIYNNNIFSRTSPITSPACAKAEAHKNIWGGTTTDAQILANTDPSRLGVPSDYFIDDYLKGFGEGTSYKSFIAYNTPQYRYMKDIIPPEPRAMNPLRYFINGGDYHEWGEQYGPCVYDYQKHMNWDARLTCTPVDNLTMILNWQLPVGLPAKYTKWGIYKKPAPPPATQHAFRNPAPTKVGTVPINATTFTDNGSVLTNAYNTEMSWRIVPETD